MDRDVEVVVRRQLDALLDDDTQIAFQLASVTNRASTAPPDGYNAAAFDRMVRTAFAPLLTADDYRLLLGDGEGVVLVVLYVGGTPQHAYRMQLSRQTVDDAHPTLGGDGVVGAEAPWRTDAVIALPASQLASLATTAHADRQRALRRRCFGAAAQDHSVSHSFGADRTHNICCEMGRASKRYSDASGNPIGRAAEAIDRDGDLTTSTWSTCLGSNVCGVLGAMYGDTHAKFAVSKDLVRLATVVPPGSPDCEAYVAKLLDTHPHGTPGIRTRGDASACPPEQVRAIHDGIASTHRDIDHVLGGDVLRPRTAVCCMFSVAGRPVHGVVKFVEVEGHNVRVVGRLYGLSPGEHGFHVHEGGDLSEGSASTCSHLNPYGASHGGRLSALRHVGDLGNITANAGGVAKFDFVDDQIRLRRHSRNVIGRMLVVHEDRDDCGLGGTEESARTGSAGRRIGCGVIGYARSNIE